MSVQESQARIAVEYLMQMVDEMRERQRAYFARQMMHDKLEAMKLEKKVDATIAKYKARGYDGSRFGGGEKIKQSKLL